MIATVKTDLSRPTGLMVAAVTLALALGGAFADSAPAARTAKSCAPRHAKVAQQDREVQVYTVKADYSGTSGRATMACLRGGHRRVRVGDSFDDGYVTSATLSRLVLIGHRVGSVQSTTDQSCKAACPPGYEATRVRVQVTDVRSGSRRQAKVTGSLLNRGLPMSRSGTVAWLEGARGSARLKTLDSRGAVSLVDSGAVDPASVRITGRTLRWVKGTSAHQRSL